MMKKFILTRKMFYTEKAEVEAESWDEANKMLYSDSTEFESMNDDYIDDASIEFIGEK